MKLVILLAATVLVGCNGCSAAQKQAEVVATIDTAICVLNHSTEQPAQIAVDCGVATAQDVIKILDAHRAAEIREAMPPAVQK